jgi:hypothetical protein
MELMKLVYENSPYEPEIGRNVDLLVEKFIDVEE